MSGLFPAHVAGAFVPIEVVPLTAAAILYWHRVMVLSWDDRPVPRRRKLRPAAASSTKPAAASAIANTSSALEPPGRSAVPPPPPLTTDFPTPHHYFHSITLPNSADKPDARK